MGSRSDEMNYFFSIYLILPAALGPGVYSASSKNQYQKQNFFITLVYLQSVHNTMSKWEETETNGEEESSVEKQKYHVSGE
jgi:hypothetical protein